MQNCPKKLKKPNSVESRSGWWRQAYPRTALESTELGFLGFLGIFLRLGDIHYGIIGFIGTVIGLVHFLLENVCFTQRILYFSFEINEFFKESIHFH